MTDSPRNPATVGRWFWLSGVAWVSMVGVLAVWAAANWNQPGFRDPDVSGPFELAAAFALIMALPFALVSAGLLAPSAMLADRWIRGRLSLTGNIVAGALIAIPAVAVFAFVNWLLWGTRRSFGAWIASINGGIGTLVLFLSIFAAGGVVMSLGMRRKPTPEAADNQIADSQ